MLKANFFASWASSVSMLKERKVLVAPVVLGRPRLGLGKHTLIGSHSTCSVIFRKI
jgi:hypothetical protein